MRGTLRVRLTALTLLACVARRVAWAQRNGRTRTWRGTSVALVEGLRGDDAVDFCGGC
jgi:hypothetical protein